MEAGTPGTRSFSKEEEITKNGTTYSNYSESAYLHNYRGKNPRPNTKREVEETGRKRKCERSFLFFLDDPSGTVRLYGRQEKQQPSTCPETGAGLQGEVVYRRVAPQVALLQTRITKASVSVRPSH